ncbi:MAG: hypothetical protein IB618_01705 [Candidatus Pacearchaeota archaeon]|nr:MAG: hypothetical protein IB618_01705 [Candidatus Pacearchaeota archaeon]
MKKSTAELWVKIIAILGFIGAVLAVIAGIAMLIGGSFLPAIFPYFEQEAWGGVIVGGVLVFVGILIMAFGVFEFIVALNLWQHKNWARIIMMIFAVLGIISGLIALPGGIVSLVIYGGIFYLLVLNKDIIKLFR